MVSVVGTLLSMLVFFALFGVFLTQYLPLWMTQNEALFTSQAENSMESLKQAVDYQSVFGAPHTLSVPFVMDSQGIPLFAQPTQGSIAFLAGGCSTGFRGSLQALVPVKVSSCAFEHLALWRNTSLLTPSYITVQNLNLTAVTNYLQMQLPNRYFPSANLYYENDAVISTENGGRQLTLVGAPLNISYFSGNVTMTGSFVSLAGYTSAAATQGSKDVYTTLISNGSYSSFDRFLNTNNSSHPSALKFNETFSVGTPNACAWYSLLSGAVNASGLTFAPKIFPNAWASLTLTGSGGALSTPPTSAVCQNSQGTDYELTLTLYNIQYAAGYTGVSQISFTNGGL